MKTLQIAKEISRQIRTISHLLHPPLLDEAGLASALRWYVDGFSGRSRIDVKLDMPSELERLPNEVELSIFRIVQECLTNVHRRSGSPSAAIRITHEDHSLRIEIEDDGTGASRDQQRAFDAKSQPGNMRVVVRIRLFRKRFVAEVAGVHTNSNQWSPIRLRDAMLAVSKEFNPVLSTACMIFLIARRPAPWGEMPYALRTTADAT
jgi:hypothetical protein